MSDASGDGREGATGPRGRDEQFTVPVPASITRALPVTPPEAAGRQWSAPTPTTEAGPPGPPPVPPNPYAGEPVWPRSTGAGAAEVVDPLLGQIGVALFWMTVGWWALVLIRVVGYLTRFGASDTILIRSIDRGPEETIIAVVLSVFAALLLLFGRGRAERSPLGWAAAGLAVVTIGAAVWRLTP